MSKSVSIVLTRVNTVAWLFLTGLSFYDCVANLESYFFQRDMFKEAREQIQHPHRDDWIFRGIAVLVGLFRWFAATSSMEGASCRASIISTLVFPTATLAIDIWDIWSFLHKVPPCEVSGPVWGHYWHNCRAPDPFMLFARLARHRVLLQISFNMILSMLNYQDWYMPFVSSDFDILYVLVVIVGISLLCQGRPVWWFGLVAMPIFWCRHSADFFGKEWYHPSNSTRNASMEAWPSNSAFNISTWIQPSNSTYDIGTVVLDSILNVSTWWPSNSTLNVGTWTWPSNSPLNVSTWVWPSNSTLNMSTMVLGSILNVSTWGWPSNSTLKVRTKATPSSSTSDVSTWVWQSNSTLGVSGTVWPSSSTFGVNTRG